jgi:type 1 glutamine amidotransferase
MRSPKHSRFNFPAFDMKILRHIWFVLFLFGCLVPALPSTAAEDGSRIVIMAVEDPNNYDAVNSMREFANRELRPLGHRVDLLEGNQALPTDFPGLVEAMRTADLLIVFVRRATLPKAQLDAIRKHLADGKPLLGIRTANHGFVPPRSAPITDSRLAAWPEFTPDVLGGQNTGYETKEMPYSVSLHPQAPKNSPLLAGVKPERIRGYQSLYKVLPLSEDATLLLLGTAAGHPPAQPIAWTRRRGEKWARIFYTSLGAPQDMQLPDSAACWSTRSTGRSKVANRTIDEALDDETHGRPQQHLPG